MSYRAMFFPIFALDYGEIVGKENGHNGLCCKAFLLNLWTEIAFCLGFPNVGNECWPPVFFHIRIPTIEMCKIAIMIIAFISPIKSPLLQTQTQDLPITPVPHDHKY